MFIRVQSVLPYLLRLPSGEYPSSTPGKPLHIQKKSVPKLDGLGAKRTAVSLVFEAPPSVELEPQLALKGQQASLLLRQINRLIRWYRAETRQATVVELTKVQASPFVFTAEENQSTWGDALTFEADPPVSSLSRSWASIVRSVRSGMAGGGEPEVASLFLLDAEQALRDGRFREAILFCWSTIDANFNTKYETIVDQILTEEWGSGRDWLKDTRFGMKNKMSVILFLTTGRSLFREPDNFWDNLSTSYKKRNRIIHSGETAQEAEAELALQVAYGVVQLMASIKPRMIQK